LVHWPRDLTGSKQEVQEMFPEAVSEESDGYLNFNMHPVNVAWVNTVKELKAKNDALEAENASLRKNIEWYKNNLIFINTGVQGRNYIEGISV
jgi:hypothetical protein